MDEHMDDGTSTPPPPPPLKIEDLIVPHAPMKTRSASARLAHHNALVAESGNSRRRLVFSSHVYDADPFDDPVSTEKVLGSVGLMHGSLSKIGDSFLSDADDDDETNKKHDTRTRGGGDEVRKTAPRTPQRPTKSGKKVSAAC